MEKKIIQCVLDLVVANIKNGIYVVDVEDQNGNCILMVDGFMDSSQTNDDISEPWRKLCHDPETNPWDFFDKAYTCGPELKKEAFLEPVERIVRKYVINLETGSYVLVDEKHTTIQYKEDDADDVVENNLKIVQENEK